MFLSNPDAHGIITLPNGIVLNKWLADKVFRLPMESYLTKSKLHALIKRETHAPQAVFVPDGLTPGDEQWRIWIAHAAGTDRREISERVYESHKWLWENEQWIYGPAPKSPVSSVEHLIRRLTEIHISQEPRQLALLDTEGNPFKDDSGVTIIRRTSIKKILKRQKVGVPGQSAKYWPWVAWTFHTTFRGDPTELYRRFGTISKIVAAKNARGDDRLKLPGFGPKIFSLLALFYAELGLIKMPPDAIPVDVHLQRIAEALGIIRYIGEGYPTNEMFEDALRLLFCEICYENNWSTEDMSHALWFNGKYLCTNCSKNKAVEDYCPMYAVCGGTLATVEYFHKGHWNTGGNRKVVGTGNMNLIGI